MKTFYKRFFGVIAIILIILFIMPSTRNEAFVITVLLPLGVIVGPYMYLSYPFSVDDKVIYTSALLLAISLIIIGTMKRKKWWGHLLVISGVLLWVSMGFLGLGTGT